METKRLPLREIGHHWLFLLSQPWTRTNYRKHNFNLFIREVKYNWFKKENNLHISPFTISYNNAYKAILQNEGAIIDSIKKTIQIYIYNSLMLYAIAPTKFIQQKSELTDKHKILKRKRIYKIFNYFLLLYLLQVFVLVARVSITNKRK